MNITIINRQKDLKISPLSTKRLASALLEFKELSCKTFNIYFVTRERICALHQEFFQDPSPTDCISFPSGDSLPSNFLGEIFICPKEALHYAKAHRCNPYDEASLYLIHGFLHLLGYKDQTPQQRRLMRKKEKECMAYLHGLKLSA